MCPYSESIELYRLGCRAELQNDLIKAQECYRLAVSLEPDSPIFIQAAAQLALRLGRHEDAENLYLEAIESADRRSGGANGLTTSLVCGLIDLRRRHAQIGR